MTLIPIQKGWRMRYSPVGATVSAQKGEREGQVWSWADSGSFSGSSETDQVSGARYGQCPLCHCHHDHTHCVSIKIIQLIERPECVPNTRAWAMGKWWLWNQAPCQTLGVNTEMWWPSHTQHDTGFCSMPRLCTKGWQVKRKDRPQPGKTNVNWVNSSNVIIVFMVYHACVWRF